MKKEKIKQKLPEFFKPLFWSVDFNTLDLNKNRTYAFASLLCGLCHSCPASSAG